MIRRAAMLGLGLLLVGLVGCQSADVMLSSEQRLSQAVIDISASRMDGMLVDLANSTKAVGEAYAIHYDYAAMPSSTEYHDRVLESKGVTTAYAHQGWSKPPAAMSDNAALYSYHGEKLTPEYIKQMNALSAIEPVLRAAATSLDYSWVYITAADDWLLIYPYLPLKKAVHNVMPTDQVFYTAANFKDRKVGWTPPYLDLVGQGMMVTASYPIYLDDEVIGVASRDVTLDQLSKHVFEPITNVLGGRVVIVDERGLLIATSDAALAKKVNASNTAAGDAVVYCRTDTPYGQFDGPTQKKSPDEQINRVVEDVLGWTSGAALDRVSYELDRRWVDAAWIPSTNWLLVWIGPKS